MTTFKHIDKLTKKELIEIIKINEITIASLRADLKKAGKIWN